ncbi:MFS transporter [Kibdelosporangium persicum]|uniref:Inner membrane metabolite transport protein YhjE n=1 Tax=Kibdelosporangium persicum TaxID=2698649 RepID=A0ABX2F2I9_9PSEU|nr:MFS transporter [Kibdelosporangium persicum]NRN65055.1 Inner membrane metabolite transport protein YhjE [Kibdelosporangium persicum]
MKIQTRPLSENREARRVAVASAIGTTIEWYDFFIYGTAAALVFAPQFFPQVSELEGTLASFATFAIGFIARPLGGIVMGHFGDRIGRKSMLVWSLMLMGIGTVVIGLLPTHAQIGVWAPILLVLMRCVQGFGLGGEWGGAVLMSVEHAPRERRGFFGGFVAFGLPTGIILSNVVFLIVTGVTTGSQFAEWAWRIPFLFGAVLVVVGLFIRLRIAESPVFQQMEQPRRVPAVDVLRAEWRKVLLAAGSYVGMSGMGYIVIVYFVSYANRQLGISTPTVLTMLIMASVVFAIGVVVFARLSDRWGRRRVMIWGCVGHAAWSLVLFPLADTKSVPLIAIDLIMILALQSAYIGPQPAMFAELFPTELRYSGTSLSLTLGTILGGAVTPLVATALYGATGTSWSVTAYVVLISLITVVCQLALKETYHKDLTA